MIERIITSAPTARKSPTMAIRFVRREIREMLTTRPRLMAVLAVATLPLVVLVLATPAKEWVKEFSGSLVAVGAFLLCTGAVLALVRRMSGGDDEADGVDAPRVTRVAPCVGDVGQGDGHARQEADQEVRVHRRPS